MKSCNSKKKIFRPRNIQITKVHFIGAYYNACGEKCQKSFRNLFPQNFESDYNLKRFKEKLLANLDDGQSEKNFAEDEECVVCLSSRATMKTYPCGHRVVCRKCFVKTIQTAVSERCLPLKCVVCRTKILKLKQVDHKSEERKSRKQSHSNHLHWQQHNHSINNNSSNNNGYNKRSIHSLPSPYQTIAIASRKHLNPHRQGDHTSVLSSSGIFTTPTISSFSRSNSSCAGHQDLSCSSSNYNGSTSNPGTSSRYSSKPSLVVQTPTTMAASSGKSTTTTPRSGDIQLIRIPPPPPVNRRRGAEKRSLSTSSSSTKNVLRISQDFGHCDAVTAAAAADAAASVDTDARMTPETSSVRNHFSLANGSIPFQEQTTSGNPVDLGLSVQGQGQGQSEVATIPNNSGKNNHGQHNYTYTINLNNFPVSSSFDGNSASSGISNNNNSNNSNNNNNTNSSNSNNLVVNKCNICQEQAKYDPFPAIGNKFSAHQIRGGTCSHHQPPVSATPPFVSRPAPVPRLMQPLLIYPAEATMPARDKKWSGLSGWSEDGGPFVSTPPSVFKVFSGKRRCKFSNLYGVD